MDILLMGAAGFIGTNLAIRLAQEDGVKLTLVDKDEGAFSHLLSKGLKNIRVRGYGSGEGAAWDRLFEGQDVLCHLVCTATPAASGQSVLQGLIADVEITVKMLEACVRSGVKRVIFLSSGGAVYGKEAACPLKEEAASYPISTYGIQKVTIEKLLYLYHHLYGLDYRIVRLSNPYGPYQRPDGRLGAVTTFTYKAMRREPIAVYGDGSVIRDFIYIDDAVEGILNIMGDVSRYRIFNLGCGYGTSIRQVLKTIRQVLGVRLDIVYQAGRPVDVPVNYLDISRYEQIFGKTVQIPLAEGIRRTAVFMEQYYGI